MKNWYLLILVFSLFSCSNNENNEPEYKTIGIEKSYPYLYEKYSIDSVDRNTVDLFKQKIHLANSLNQLKESQLFNYCPDILKEEFVKCDFENYTLILTSSSTLNEIVDLKYTFSLKIYSSEYQYFQTSYSRPLVKPVEYIYFVLNAFVVKKIPDDAKIIFLKSLTTV